MTIKNGQCLHVVLFGTFNENKYFLGDYRNSFDLIGFNANIIAHAPEGIAAFVSQLTNKTYFIDPQMHAFQQPIRTVMRKKDVEWVLKESVKKLSEFYGSIIKYTAGKESISAGTLSDQVINEICKNVLNFEAGLLETASQEQDYRQFLDFADENLRPSFLVAPYFYIEPDNFDKELEDNIKFLTNANSILKSEDALLPKMLFAEIVMSQEVLFDSERTNKIVAEYKECRTDGFLIWIDNFSEVDVSETLLKKYKNFLKKLAGIGKPIINLHGSYFSIALSGKAGGLLAGVGHGIEYGEYRPVIPVGGGVPLAKFYFPQFHKRVDYDPDAANILLEMDWIKNKKTYFSNVCSCKMCQEVIRNDDVASGFQEYGKTAVSKKNGKAYPTAEAMDKSRRHYLNTKNEEYKFCRSSSISDIWKNLQTNGKIAEKLQKIHPFDHLKKWGDVLKV